MTTTETISSKLLGILKSVADTDEVQRNLDLPLYDSQVLDSMNTVQLIAEIENEFGVVVPLSDFDRDKWATPRLIIADIETRLAA